MKAQIVDGYTSFNGTSTPALNDGLVGTATTNPSTAFDLDGPGRESERLDSKVVRTCAGSTSTL